jgi:hypothetical protein
MAFKTFNFRSGRESWSSTKGLTITLHGGIYTYNAAKTFRNIKFIELVEKADQPSVIKGDTWTIQADPELQKKCQSMFHHDRYWERPELIIKSKGKNIEDIFATMGCNPD